MACIQWCNNTLPDFQSRLKRAAELYGNLLSDHEKESSESVFKGFGDLIVMNPPLGTPFYCKLMLSNPGAAIIHKSSVVTHDGLDGWLFKTDAYAADNLNDYRFKGFSGSAWSSVNGFQGFQIEAEYVKR